MDVTGLENYTEDDVNSSAKTDELLCDLQRTSESNMIAGSGYEYFGDEQSGTDSGDTDCSGEGTTWGPGIGPPPTGCGRGGYRRLQGS
jgi:hypothetical protein